MVGLVDTALFNVKSLWAKVSMLGFAGCWRVTRLHKMQSGREIIFWDRLTDRPWGRGVCACEAVERGGVRKCYVN